MLTGVPFRSYRDGVFYNDPSAGRTVYMMESGRKRPCNSAQAFFRVGGDFDTVIKASTKELSVIPLGETIY
jgi:hypothetical protein